MSDISITPARSVSVISILEFVGFVTAVVGTGLLSCNIGMEFVAFVSYAISNVAWIAFSVIRQLRWLWLQNVMFLLFTLNGLIQFWPG